MVSNDIIVDGRTRVVFLPTIASPLLIPTLTELAAGILLHDLLIPAGLEGWDVSQADVDNSALGSQSDSKLPGRKSFSGTGLVFKKQAVTDPVFALLATENTDGYIGIRDEKLATLDWAAAQTMETYSIRTGEHGILGRGEANSVLRYRIPTPISGPYNKKVVIPSAA